MRRLLSLAVACGLTLSTAVVAAPDDEPAPKRSDEPSPRGSHEPSPKGNDEPTPHGSDEPTPGHTDKPAHAGAADGKPGKPKLPPPPPELLLTFDDGPHLERTPKVLDVLEQHHIHAVFFVNGVHFLDGSRSSEKSRELLREMVARGHAIGNHTIHHYFLCGKVYAKRADEEIEGNARLIEQAIGRRPELFRTPYGSHCASLAATLARLGVKHTGWDIDPQDWKVLSTNKVRDYITNHLRHLKSGREILLMHDIHQDTVEALPQILDWLDAENADRTKRGEPPIRIIDYSYLLPPRPAVPPILDGIGRILIEQYRLPDPSPLLALVTGRARRS